MAFPLVPLALAGGSALAGGLSSAFKSKPKIQNINRFNPQQQGALSQLLNQGTQNSNFDNIQQGAQRNFATNTVPGLAERFTSLGGGQRSSAFQGALGNAGAQLNSDLGALKSQYGLQQLGLGLTPQSDQVYKPTEHNFFSGSLGGLSGGLGALGGAGLMQHITGAGNSLSGNEGQGGQFMQWIQGLQPNQKQQLIQMLQGS